MSFGHSITQCTGTQVWKPISNGKDGNGNRDTKKGTKEASARNRGEEHKIASVNVDSMLKGEGFKHQTEESQTPAGATVVLPDKGPTWEGVGYDQVADLDRVEDGFTTTIAVNSEIANGNKVTRSKEVPQGKGV